MTLVATTTPCLHSFAYALDYLREQLADVPEADLAKLAPGIANHPAWVIGHLTWICQQIGGVVGLEPWLPSQFDWRFGTGSTPGEAFEGKAAALARLGEAAGRLTRAVEALTDEQLAAPFPDPTYRDVFPTVGHAITQVLVGHTSFHVGQVSVWRRAMGLDRLGRGFE